MEDCYRIHYACELGDQTIVEQLLDNGIHVDICDDYCTTPLQVAAANGHVEVVRLLLMRGATLDECNILGWTALLHACRYGHLTVVLSLLQNQTDINIRTRLGVSALMLASRGGHLALCKCLMDAGHTAAAEPLDVRGVDEVATCEFNSVMIASHYGHDSTIRYLLNRGYDVNSRTASTGVNALMLTALNGHMTTAQVLIERGADADLTNVNKMTALDLGEGHREVKGYLQRKTTVKKNVQKISEPKKAKSDIFEAVKDSDTSRLARIIDSDPCQCNVVHEGGTPLIYAAIAGNQAACDLLLTQGHADVDKRDERSGWTALMQSIYYGHSEVTRYLLTAGADVLLPANDGCTAFQMASLIDDIDTDLYRSIAAKVTEANGDDMDNKKDGKGLKIWWKRTSNRFRALKIGRTLNFSTNRLPASVETNNNNTNNNNTIELPGPTTTDIISSSSPKLASKLKEARTTSIMENEKPEAVSLMTTSFDSILRKKALNSLEKTKEKHPFHQPNTKSRHEMPPMTSRRSCGAFGSTSTLTSPRPIVAPVKLLQSYSNVNSYSNTSAAMVNSGQTSSSNGLSLSGGYHAGNMLNTGYYGTSSSSPSSSGGASGLSGVFSRSRSSGTSSTLTAGIGPNYINDTRSDELDSILKNLSLEKFKPIFEEQEVDMEAFLSLTENDLTEIGISQQTSRTRILSAIEQLTTGKNKM